MEYKKACPYQNKAYCEAGLNKLYFALDPKEKDIICVGAANCAKFSELETIALSHEGGKSGRSRKWSGL